MKELYLTSYTSISPAGIQLEGNLIAPGLPDTEAFFKKAYNDWDLSYPKYFKMDRLCKLGILGVEPFFKQGRLLERYKNDEVALVFANSSSSLQSDVAHYANYSGPGASPAVFVYTLPNIVIGEICIKHQLYSESNFYIFERFNAESLLEQAKVLLSQSSCKACILAWAEYYDERCEGVFFLLEKSGTAKASPALLQNIKNKMEDGQS